MSNGVSVPLLIRSWERSERPARFSSAARHIVERDQCTTILCSTPSLGPSKREARPTCRWRNIWNRVEADPMRYANAAERLLAAIGEPQMIDTAKDPRLGRIFLNRTIRAYPAFAGFYGMEETIERIVGFLPPCGAGPGRAQADPLSARPGRRRQVVARRAAEVADGSPSDLCAEGRRRTQPGVRKPARACSIRTRWGRCSRRNTAFRAAA